MTTNQTPEALERALYNRLSELRETFEDLRPRDSRRLFRKFPHLALALRKTLGADEARQALVEAADRVRSQGVTGTAEEWYSPALHPGERDPRKEYVPAAGLYEGALFDTLPPRLIKDVWGGQGDPDLDESGALPQNYDEHEARLESLRQRADDVE